MGKGKSLVSVEVKKGDINKALKILKRRIFDSGHLQELRERQQFEKPTTKRRKQKEKAIREQYIKTIKDQHELGNFSKELPTKKNRKKK
jgi:small subunit ribosomal protein S21